MVKYNTMFYKNGVIFHACVHERGRIFSREATSGFFQKFFYGGGPKSGEICFLSLETEKTTFLLKFSNSCHPSDTHACVS